MPIQMKVPLEKEYTLVKSDKQFDIPENEPTRVTIRQARQAAHERRSSLFAQVIREMSRNESEDIVRLIQRFSFEELKRIEVFLTLAGCNIKDENGRDLFKFNAQGHIAEDDFNHAWGLLDPSIAQEIHECVLDLNKDWRAPTGEVS
jgi:hypothetical protein